LKSPLKLQKNPSQFPSLFSFFYFSLYSATLSLSTLWSLKWRRNPKNVTTMKWFLLWYRLSGEKMQTATQQIPTFVSSENPFPPPKPVTDGPTATNQRWTPHSPFTTTSLLSKSSFFVIFFLMCCFLFLIQSKVEREEVAGSKEEEWVSLLRGFWIIWWDYYGFKHFGWWHWCRGSKSEEKEVLQARCHYTQAMIDGSIYNLNDDAYVQVYGWFCLY